MPASGGKDHLLRPEDPGTRFGDMSLTAASRAQASLGQWAADNLFNQSQIDLVGLAATGLECIA